MSKEISEKIERWKLLAEQLLKQNKRIYICDINNQFYFADILLIGEETITIQCFSPLKRKNEKYVLNWFKIKDMEEYKPFAQSLKIRWLK